MTGGRDVGGAPAGSPCEQARAEVAVALLTRQPVPAGVGDHLDRCDGCRVEAIRLGEATGLLGQADAGAITAGDDPRVVRLLAEAGRRQRRRRTLATTAVAAAAAALVAVPLAGRAMNPTRVAAGGTIAAPAPAVDRAATDPATGAWARLRLSPGPTGTAVAVDVRGVPAGTRCTVTLDLRDGRRVEVVTWTVDYRDTGTVATTLPVPADDVAAMTLADPVGRQLVVVPVVG